jgi:hypothetical protein
MPNLDGGHYFLTVLAPIRVDLIIDKTPGRSRSHRHQLAQKLALVATGRQTAVSPPDAWTSPFAKNTLNHLARFVIIGGPAYNGRLSGDTLIGVARKINPLTPQPVDRLRIPYLLFAADIDAPGDGEAALRAYTDSLWATMNKDLVEIFNHCAGFEGVVNSAETFYGYIRKCQVETTMPFNDYWPDGLPVGNAELPTTTLIRAAKVTGAVLAAWLAALVLYGLLVVFGFDNRFVWWVSRAVGWGVIVIPLLVGVVALIAYGLYRWILQRGQPPLPTAPGCDLPSVLKSLYLQQHFTRFAIEAQGLSDAKLHARFGAFLAAVQPAAASPTQPPGEVRAPAVEWAQ